MHDPRVGRFFAVDPLARQYSHNSPYVFSENIVINAVELEGREMTFSYSNIDVENISNNRSKINITYDVDINFKILNITKDKSKLTGIDKLSSSVQKRINATFGNLVGSALFTPTHDLEGNPLMEDNLLKQVDVNAKQRRFKVSMEVVDDVSEINSDDYVIILTDKELNETRNYDPSESVNAYATKNGQAMILNIEKESVKKSVTKNEYDFYGNIRKITNTVNHEFGHFLGLADKYEDKEDGYSLPDEFKTNVMGDARFNGLNREQKSEVIFNQMLRYNSFNKDGNASSSGNDDTKEILNNED